MSTTSSNSTDFTEKATTALKNFVSLLDVIQTTYSNVTVVLPLIELSSPIQQAWLKQFDVTLVTYQTLYDLNVRSYMVSPVFTVGKSYTVKKDWYL